MNGKYEAWRNFILILASLLVGECFVKHNQIKRAVSCLLDYDKTVNFGIYIDIITILVIIYVAKNAHGILITLFDVTYIKKVQYSKGQTLLFYIFTTSIVLSFSFVLRLLSTVPEGYTLYERSCELMIFTLFPSIVYFIFDTIQSAFLFESSDTDNRLKMLLKEIISSPFKRESHEQYKRIWIAEDFLSIIIIVIWILVFKFLPWNNGVKIVWTIIIYSGLLFINSILDYFLNFYYFFPVKTKP